MAKLRVATGTIAASPRLPASSLESVVKGRFDRPVLAFALVWLAAAGLGLALALRPAHPLSDVTHYKYWTRLATVEGVGSVYAGQYPETYAIYPPVTLYGLGLIGQAYQEVVDPTFEPGRALASHGLTVAIRLLSLGMHLVLGAVLFSLLLRPAGGGWAVICSGLYLLNPGALWDVAVWGQPDSWHALFVLLAVWTIGHGRLTSGGAWSGLGVMTKPQTWVLAPVLVCAIARSGGIRGLVRAVLAGGVVVLIVLIPFIAQGRLRDVTTLPAQIANVMPVASANAHNLWWLVTRGVEPFVLDSEPIGGPLTLTYRQISLLLITAALAFTLVLVWTSRGPWALACLAAFFVLAWFSFTTGAHENHLFMLFPLLCLVAWRCRFLIGLLLLLIAQFSFNVLVHDFSLAPSFGELLGGWNLRLQFVSSAFNLAMVAVWAAWLVRFIPAWSALGRSAGP